MRIWIITKFKLVVPLIKSKNWHEKIYKDLKTKNMNNDTSKCSYLKKITFALEFWFFSFGTYKLFIAQLFALVLN